MQPHLAYETELGACWLGESVDVLRHVVPDDSVDLIVTSPPFALLHEKEYGNRSQDEYVAWFQDFADEFWRVLAPHGSLVIDLGSAWEPKSPTKSLYAFELLISLCRRPRRRFHLAQDFYWFNPARLPSPAQWVTIKRVRAKDAVNYVWWLSKTPNPRADNRKVVEEYTPAMRRLIRSGVYNRGRRPSGHVIGEGFTADRGGAIPPNLLCISNTGNDKMYADGCKRLGLRPHPARFPHDLPRFFIDFLTNDGDIVLDPFAGSNVTGSVAESLGRRWIAIDCDEDYVAGSRVRFENLQLQLTSNATRRKNAVKAR